MYLSSPPTSTWAPSVTTFPSESTLALNKVFVSQEQLDLISIRSSATSKRRREPGNKCVWKSVRRPKHITFIPSISATAASWSTCSGVRNCASSTRIHLTFGWKNISSFWHTLLTSSNRFRSVGILVHVLSPRALE